MASKEVGAYSTRVEPIQRSLSDVVDTVGFPVALAESPLVMHRAIKLDTFHELMKERSEIMWTAEKEVKTIKPEESARGHRATQTHQGFFYHSVERGATTPPFDGFTRWDQFQAVWVHLSELDLNDFSPSESGRGDLETVKHTYEIPERWEALQFATNDYMGRVDVLEHFKDQKLFVAHVVNKKLPSVGFVDFCLAVKAVQKTDTEWYCAICSVTHPKCPERPGVRRVVQLGSVLWINDQTVRYTLALKDQRVSGCLTRCLGGSNKVDQILLRQYWEGQEEAFQRTAKFDVNEHKRELEEEEKAKRKSQKKTRASRRSSFGMGTQMALQV